MKNVLLPTDLSVQSLYPIHKIVKEAQGQKPSIQVIHMLSLPTGIGDLLSLRENKLYSAIPVNFTEAFQMLCHKYKASINKLEFRFVYCNTSRYLNNFIEGNEIDEVYMLSNYKYTEPLSQSIDFPSYFNKCKVPVHYLPLHSEASEYQNLSSLLNADEHYKKLPANKVVKQAISY